MKKTTPEQDLRLDLLNTLLTTPHRQLDAIQPLHAEMVRKDPLFYVRLAAWYNDHGEVRDHKEMFIITLVLSDFEGHRDTGLAMRPALLPYQVFRFVDFGHGRQKTVRAKPAGKQAAAAKSDAAARATVQKTGLFRNAPRSLRTEVTRYLREREADADWFDSSVLIARKAMKRLYALYHVAPGQRAQQTLFDETPPADGRVFALKQLAKATTSEEQARAIVEHQIPYRIAATVVQQMTPAVLSALVERMRAQELINNLAALRRRGAFDDPGLKALIEGKLEQAKGAQRVSALKAEEAVKAADVSTDVRRKLEAVADSQVKAKGRIERSMALLIDKSGSMSLAIELGKRIGALLSAVASGPLHVVAFDTAAHRVAAPVEGTDLAGWERALAGVKAGGGTSCGIAVDYLRRQRFYVEQIILVTDEGENTAPYFVDALKQYREEVRTDPNVCFVRTPGASTQLEEACRKAGILADAFQFSGDYYALPNLVPLLSRPSKLDLLMEIMEYPLPARKPA